MFWTRRDSSGKFVAIQVMEKLRGSRLGGTDLSTQLPAPQGAKARVLKVEDQPRILGRPYLKKPGNKEQW